MPKTLFIDADACPVTRESIDSARRAGVAVVIAGNSTQNLERHIRRGDPRDAEHARRGFWVTTLDVAWEPIAPTLPLSSACRLATWS